MVCCGYGSLSDPDVCLVPVFDARSEIVLSGVLVGCVYQDELELERDRVVVGAGADVTRVHLLQSDVGLLDLEKQYK